MPVDEYFQGEGRKVMRSMKNRYGKKAGKQAFYAAANKRGMTPSRRSARPRRGKSSRK